MKLLQKFMRTALCLSLQLPLMAAMATPAEAVPLLTGFGGPSGYGLPENCVPPNDDGSYPRPVPITAAFPMGINFFGTVYREMYVNNNGNITFRGPLGTYTPMPFPVAMQPMIAPWWADVDTRGLGMPMRNNVCFHVERNRVVVTWNRVGYFSAHDDLQNDFQLILTTSNTCATTGDFDVEFRYNQCQWITGDASGGTCGGVCPSRLTSPMCMTGCRVGTPAQVGFDAGNMRNFVALPMSRTPSIIQVCSTSNVPGGPPGLWRFQIRGGDIAAGCTGGGTACTVPGQRGACAQGVNICAGMGVTCRQVNMPREERCNGNDDDCDGMIDEGEMLCPTNFVCDRGSCVERCSAELGCNPGRTCSPSGICVENACMDVRCPEGQRCVAGNCVGICDGVTCPANQICRAGRCVNPCVGVTCDPMEVCDPGPGPTAGLCVPGCQCRPCPAGQTCQPDGYCVTDDCAGVTCPTGTYCRGGMCRDACEAGPDTRLCPTGESCVMGECVPGPVRDSGTSTDATADAPRTDAGRNDAGRTDAGRDVPRVDAGGVPDADDIFFTPRARGCQCSTVGARHVVDARWGAMVVGLGLVAMMRRRRGSKRP